ncbi:3-keto-5-aminohexanoate cleavage protein [Antarcticimicrobium sediminis]|uniref:3-keto-5-aminohexanoate cleavage protein n=1 Tax=Antarcticimicrobium sediminis TaxID=2546227 RepID=A0A4R5EPM0_9RHOB|nr:3-keto-5-aminohexanoate cleavage protein [Antarcticimicrobium sediminis]TDE36598.1 3-keto-5-aminohexanoate cleavage protein [Antarcticimicrobium sediminis]
MPLKMRRKVFITAAITGAGATQDKSRLVPRSPQEIAEAAIAAAKAGAAVVHCHVRDPETGAAVRDVELYRDLTRRIRNADVDVVLNLTAGIGGDLTFGDAETPMDLDASGTDMIGATERLAHIRACLPEVCTLDCGSMNFGDGDYVMTNTTNMLRAMGRQMTELGVKPEIEAFDTGHLWFATQLVKEGILADPALVQLCMGIPWGAPNDLLTLLSMVQNVPAGWTWSAFSLGRDQMPYVAAAALAGGNVRVGLEDNIYLERGVLATNAQLVEKAVGILDRMGVGLMGPDEVRAELGLVKRVPEDLA